MLCSLLLHPPPHRRCRLVLVIARAGTAVVAILAVLDIGEVRRTADVFVVVGSPIFFHYLATERMTSTVMVHVLKTE